MKRICTGCDQVFSLDQFNWRDRSKGIRHSRCRECTKKQSKNAYLANRGYYISYNRSLKAKRRQRHLQRVWDFLILHPCVDCGESDPVVLDFDHVGNDKMANISYLLNSVGSWRGLRLKSRNARFAARTAIEGKRLSSSTGIKILTPVVRKKVLYFYPRSSEVMSGIPSGDYWPQPG